MINLLNIKNQGRDFCLSVYKQSDLSLSKSFFWITNRKQIADTYILVKKQKVYIYAELMSL